MATRVAVRAELSTASGSTSAIDNLEEYLSSVGEVAATARLFNRGEGLEEVVPNSDEQYFTDSEDVPASFSGELPPNEHRRRVRKVGYPAWVPIERSSSTVPEQRQRWWRPSLFALRGLRWCAFMGLVLNMFIVPAVKDSDRFAARDSSSTFWVVVTVVLAIAALFSYVADLIWWRCQSCGRTLKRPILDLPSWCSHCRAATGE